MVDLTHPSQLGTSIGFTVAQTFKVNIALGLFDLAMIVVIAIVLNKR